MAPAGATREYVKPKLDPMAAINRTVCVLLLVLSCAYSLPIRSEKRSADDYYMNGNIRCLRCPAGEFVKTPCTVQYSRGECEPCSDGTYSEHPSGMFECLRCTRCRSDQEEISSCSASKNTRCRCKEGTFCPQGQSCEICTRCATSCPEDQVVQASCNSTSDIQCAPGDSTHTGDTTAIVCGSVIPIILIVIIIIGVVIWLKKKNSDTGSKLIKQLTVSFCKPKRDGDQDADAQLLPVTLKMKEGPYEREEIISKSRVVFVDKIPPKKFEKFMLKLGLAGNDIERAKMDHQGTEDQNHAMLKMWYEQKNFDVNQLLKTLRSLGMGKAADDIADQLVRDELYIEQTSN